MFCGFRRVVLAGVIHDRLEITHVIVLLAMRAPHSFALPLLWLFRFGHGETPSQPVTNDRRNLRFPITHML
jgi:hypothetical protein